MVTIPRLVVAAPSSGQGKTTVATGLMAALSRKCLSVSGHKVGPDYIDPSYHAMACGRPPRNLDPFLQSEDLIRPLFLHGALTPRPADIAVVEGVMGLFDGRTGTDGFASTAHVSTLLSAPVVLVVDATAAARSIGATVKGFAEFDDRVRVAAVILNNIGSAAHEADARAGISSTGVPVVGVIPRDSRVAVPSRHLGLIPVAERRPEARRAVEALGVLVGTHVDLDAVMRIARSAAEMHDRPWSPADALGAVAATPTARGTRARVAVAAGAAFSFGYTETVELLEAAGADVASVDPLNDERLPDATQGLVIGGGFPEAHAGDLSANAPLRRHVARFAGSGGVVAAECAGLLYLADDLDGAAMCGVLPLRARFGPTLTLGYRTATTDVDSVLSRAGRTVTGHEFHRTTAVPTPGATDPTPAWRLESSTGVTRPEGLVRGNVHASYLHVHWAGHPHLAQRFVSSAATVGA